MLLKNFIFLCLIFTSSLNAMEIKILTHNLAMKENRALYQHMSNHLTNMNLTPDIIFVQEAVNKTPDYLRQIFKMDGHFTKRPWDNEAVGVLTRFEISKKLSLTINARADNGFTRTASMIEFYIPNLGLVRAVSIHFAYRLDHEQVRYDQLIEVKEWIDVNNKIRPAQMNILGGDFNAAPSSKIFEILDQFDNYNSNIITHFPTKRRIDYIFVQRKNKKTKLRELFPFPNGKVEGLELSDHKSVLMLMNI